MGAASRMLHKLIGDTDDLEALKIVPPKERVYTERELIERESKVGSTLFGPVPAGRRREFFCVDERSWIWYEEFRDAAGKLQSNTVRYEIQPAGILKSEQGARYSYLEGAELQNFMAAINAYRDKVAAAIYAPVAAAA